MPSADSQDYLWIAVGDIHDEPERFAKYPNCRRLTASSLPAT